MTQALAFLLFTGGASFLLKAQPASLNGSLALHTDSMGAGAPTIVFLSGLGATSSYWARRVRPLAETHKLLLPDPIGFGRSARPDSTYSLGFHVRAVQPLLDSAGPIVLVGHSFGALVAATYARAHPENVQGLVLISAPVYASRADALAQLSQRNPIKQWVMAHRSFTILLCSVTRRIARPLIPLLAPDLPGEIRDDATAHTARAATSTLHDGLYPTNGFDLLRALPLDLPVLIIHGDADRTAPWAALKQLLAERPEWQQLVLRNIDHHPLLRSPESVTEAIRVFAASPPRPPAILGMSPDLRP